MEDFQNHYNNLQVAENASPEVIKVAYRVLAQKWHPDKHRNDQDKAEKVMRIINQAFAVLSDPERRNEHDQWIKLKRESVRNPEQSPSPSEMTFSWSKVAKIAAVVAAAAFGIDMSDSL